MADVNSLFEEYLNAGVSALDDKKAQVAVAATQKKGYIGGATADVGLTPETTGADLLGMTDVNAATAEASGRSDYMSDASHQRTWGQTLGDSTIDVINGAFQGALGIGGVAAGLVDPAAGAAVAQAGQDVTEYTSSLQSDALNDRRRANEARNEVTQKHNFELSKQEMEAGSSEFMSGLRRVGRDFVDSITNADKETFISGVSNGVGSLLLGGVIGKGVKVAGGALAARAAVGAAGPSRAAFAINQATKAGAMPAAIGALEGGGAYTQTVNEVMGISHEQLLQSSPDYQALIEQGWDPDDARAEVANHAGLAAAAIQAPVGVATGALVSKFEGAPFHIPNLKTAVGDILREGVEEGIQSGSGQLATNYGIQQNADVNQDMLEGVGRNAGEGSLYGMGTAGAIQGPTIAVKAPIDLAKYAGSKAAMVAKVAAAPLVALGERREKAALDESHARSMAQLSEANTAVTEAATPESLAAINDSITANISDPEEAKTASDYVAKVYSSIHVDHEAEAEAEPNPAVADAIRSSKDRFDVLRRVSNLVVDPEADEQTKSEAALYLADALNKYDSLLSTTLPDAINAVEEEDPALAPLRQFEDVVANFVEHPTLNAAIAKASEVISNFNVDESNPASVATAAKIAEVAPDKAKLEDVDTVLRHASEGKIQLSPESKAAIEETQRMLQTAQALTESIEKVAPAMGRKPVNAVSHEVLLDPSQATKAKSGAAHFAGIVDALRNGNRQLAATRLEQFMNFAKHMQNKVVALNENYAKGDGSKTNDTKYQQLSLGGKFQPSITGMWVNPRVAKPVAFAQLVEAEARAITSLANRLASINPDLGVKPLSEIGLVAGLQGSVDEVVSRHRDGGTAAAPIVETAKVEPAPDAKAEPKATPAVEPAPEQKPGATVVEAKPAPQPEVKAEVKPEPVAEAAEPAEAQTEAKAEPKAPETKEKTPTPEVAKVEPSTQVELEVEPEVEAEVADPTTVAEAFPGLIAVATNWFHKAFRLPQAPISRLFQLANPMADVRKAARSAKAAEKFGAKLDKALEPKTAKAFDRLFDRMAPVYKEMQATLEYLLNQKFGTKDAPRGTFEEALLSGSDDNVAMLRRARILNLVEQTPDGKIAYNENLLQGALLAGMNWLLTGGQRSRSYDAESVAKIIQVDEADVTQADIDFFNGTLYTVDAVETLVNSIRRYWNVQASKGVDIGHVDGIPEAIAKDLIEAFAKTGLLKLVPHEVLRSDSQSSYVGIETTVPDDIIAGTAGFPDLIEQLVTLEPEVSDHIGTPPAPQTHQLLAGRRVKLPAQQAEAAENVSQDPHKVNTTILELVSGLGPQLVTHLFGHSNLDDPLLNKQHKLSMEGFNRTIIGALRQVGNLAAQMASKAKLEGVDPASLPIYYNYEFSRVNRMHMQGKFNPQANKLMRVLVSPHAQTIDLSSQTGLHHDLFMLAIAQHLGVKVHRIGRAAAIADVQTRLQDKYGESLQLLQGWLNDKTPLDADQVELLRGALGVKSDPIALYSLIEYARFLNADAKARKSFETSLYLEADGITDGPINGIMHLATGEFNADWFKHMAAGGLYFDADIKTLADYIASATEGSESDLYEKGTVGLNKAMKLVRARDDGNSRGKVGQTRVALLYAMDKLLDGEVNFDYKADAQGSDDALKFERGVTKNPMTVTMYGAAEKGIASKIVHSLVQATYAQMSTGTLDAGLSKALEVLTSRRAVLTKGGKNAGKVYVFDEPAEGQAIHPDNFVDFQFSAEQLANLKDNVRILFVDSLNAGIQEVVKDTNTGKRVLQAAVQIQSIAAQHMFKTLVEEAIKVKAEKDPSWKTHQALSRDEIDAIHARVADHYHLLIETGTQTFYPAATGNAPIHEAAGVKDPIELSRSSHDRLGTPLMIEGPANAGVRALPYMTIGTGDGQVIQDVITDIERPEGAEYVFDGINVKLTTLEADSRIINKSVYNSWLKGNPLQAVSNSFEKFLEVFGVNELADLPDDLQNEVFRALGPMSDVTDLARLGRDLKRYALENQARKNALARVNLNVDHMASAEAPHVETGKIQLKGTFAEKAEQLNVVYREELAKLTGEDAREVSPRETESKPESKPETEEETRIEDGTSEAYIMPAGQMITHLPKFEVAGNLIPLVKEALASVSMAGYQFAMGTRAQIQGLLNQQGVAYQVESDDRGLMSPRTKTMYLIERSGETLVHELLHGATLTLVQSYYNEAGIDNLTQHQVDAIQRIDEMMIEFMELDAEGLDADTTQSLKEARVEIQSRLDNDQRAEAVNEFMSWVLANQDLRQLASKTTLKSALAKISLKVLEALKQLLWGKKAPSVADDLLSNLEFNTRVLIAEAQTPVTEMLDTTMRHQSRAFGRNEKLKDLRVRYAAKIGTLLKDSSPAERLDLKSELVDVLANADIVTEAVIDHGFSMTGQEKSTFRMMVAAFATEARFDTNALARVQQLYSHVTKQLTVESFMSSTEADSQSVQDVDRHYAQQKFNSVMGDFTHVKDKVDRSALLSSFLALAMTNEEFQAVLAKIELPKSEKNSERTTDAVLENAGTGLMDRLAVTMSGEGLNQPDVQAALDALNDRIVAGAIEDESTIEQFVTNIGNSIDKGNGWIVDSIDRLSGKASDYFQDKGAQAQNKASKALFGLGEALTGLINESRNSAIKSGAISAMNNMSVPRWMKEVFTEIVGRTEDNATIYDMIKRVRSLVQQTRQQFREHLPKQIEKQFTAKIDKSQWAAMTRGLARIDVAALADGFSLAQIMNLLANPGQVSTEIGKLEEELAASGGTNWPLWQTKAKELAEYLNSGKPPRNLLRNAHAIAYLYGEISPLARRKLSVTNDQIKALDQLTSLYAMDGLDLATRNTLSDLVGTEQKGMDFVMSYLIGQRKGELDKVDLSSRAQINSWKGHYPTEGEAGATIIVKPDADEARLKMMGFTKGEPYKTSVAERGAPAQSYYYAPVSGKALYHQGILQNVRSTANGVDPRTGFSVGIPMAGQLDDPAEVARAVHNLRHNGARDTQALLPIYDEDGTIIAFERSMDPVQTARLKRNDHMGEVLGIWVGRQVEEFAAKQFNSELVAKLAAKHTLDVREGKAGEYVNLFSREALRDPIYRDAINLMTPEARTMVAQHFDEGEFWVRKDMINDAIGYRAASVGDVWTGTTRLHPEIQKHARSLAIGVFGQDAYKKVVQAEKIYQTVISDARVTIVVKSVVVPMANLISNVYHLAARGVPIQHIIKGFPKKTAEIDAFVKGRIRRIELEGLEKAAQGRGDDVALRRIQTELQAIRDANRRMSIWPLLKVGEFSAISDAAISHEEIQLSEGRLSDYMESLTKQLPDELKTVGRYGIVGKDTALFKGLQRAVEYGDFLAKAVLYDDLTIRQKKSKAYALARISEEFVNYDRLPGRGRGYLENMGLMWFWHFKLRAIKVAASTIRHNPLHLFLAHLAPMPDLFGSVGTPVTDNALSIIAEGKAGWSLGIGQAIHAQALNPWVNLFT